MRNFILGCCFILLTAAGTASIMTVKPATPKSVVVYSGLCPGDFIMKYHKLGYIVKPSGGGYSLIVMEKY